MKKTFTVLLISCASFSFSQVERYTAETDFKGPIKSVSTYNYRSDVDDSEFETDQVSLHPTCEVCDHFEKFDEKGRLIEKQEYVIIEPVSDLGMGYCLHLDFEYEKKELVQINSKKFEFHDMGLWGYRNESTKEEIMYSTSINGNITTTEYINQWEETRTREFENGLLIRDDEKTYTYNDKGRLIKSVPINGGSISNRYIDTWTYSDDLLVEHTKMDTTGNYFFGHQTQYLYYDSGKLLSEKEYGLEGPNETDEKELRSINYFYEDGRDSLNHFVNVYSAEKTKRNFTFEYLFHPNGTISSKTQKTQEGEVCGFESFDDRGNLTQYNSYNISSDAYKIERFTFNDKNQLIEMNVSDYQNEEEYSMVYEYDEYGNETHTYHKSDGLITLVQKQVFEYY